MIRYNLTICSYCFNVYALAVASNTLLTSSCTLHSRKFPTKPLVHTYQFISLIDIGFIYIAFPFLVFICLSLGFCGF